MKIGYVRVSKHEQNEALQIDALKDHDTWWEVDFSSNGGACRV